MALYNSIGTEYNSTRRADPYLTERIYEHLNVELSGKYLDIGCGTGNYLKALTDKGVNIIGVDPSEVMLKQARLKNPTSEIIQGSAENIPFPDNTFDGAIALFTFHHWLDKQKSLHELNRVLKPGSHLVFLSFTPEQLEGYWLCHYFPEMMKTSMTIIPDLVGMEKILSEANFKIYQSEKYFIKDDLQDLFLYSGKHFPERYLNPVLRKNVSSFSAFSNEEEVASGLIELEKDINSGKINSIINQYENDLGDYIFINAVKI